MSRQRSSRCVGRALLPVAIGWLVTSATVLAGERASHHESLPQVDKAATGRSCHRPAHAGVGRKHRFKDEAFPFRNQCSSQSAGVFCGFVRSGIQFARDAADTVRPRHHALSPQRHGATIYAALGLRDELLSRHTSGLEDFLEPERMRFVESRERVAGFQSHRFGRMPQMTGDADRSQWIVTRLELVSLLKHKTPRDYVSAHLPRMDELNTAPTPTRPLDGFETAALLRLRYDEYLVSEQGLNRIRMLGSLRAGKRCLACRSVRSEFRAGRFCVGLFRAFRLHVVGLRAFGNKMPDGGHRPRVL